MIILPDRNIARAKILMPMLPREWRTPSQAQPKNVFGHENQFRFCATARYRGRIVWRGWFDDREDFDRFIWAMVDGSIERDHYVQRLPTPWWSTDLGEGLTYEFVTTVFIVSGTSWSVPADCTGVSGQSGEFIDTIGGGGSGCGAVLNKASGGGAGAFSRITSLALTPSGSVTIQIGAFGAGSSGAGNPGTDTWFNGSTLALSSVGAKAGGGGATGASPVGGAGGLASAGVGTTKNNGGTGGNVPTAGNGQGTGGGGAGGPTGAGNNSPDGTGQGTGSAGGSGDAGAGGAGGAGVANANGPTGVGGNGTEYDASHGSGGGSGGLGTFSGPIGAASSGAGGNYGGASGGVSARSTGSALTGAARPGLAVVAYVPFVGGARSFGVIIH